jgi:hypothetical protein
MEIFAQNARVDFPPFAVCCEKCGMARLVLLCYGNLTFLPNSDAPNPVLTLR